MRKPKPDSAEWWQQVAQGLGVQIQDLRALLIAQAAHIERVHQEHEELKKEHEDLLARIGQVGGSPR